MKKLITYTLFLMANLIANFPLYATEKTEPVTLTSKLLGLADGKSYGVNADRIGATLQLKRMLIEFQMGKKMADGLMHGIFMFEDAPMTIKGFCALEDDYAIEYHALQDALKHGHKNIDACANLNQKKSVLTQHLEQIKTTFSEKTLPFAEHAQGMQDLMFALIADSCNQRHRIDSFLLTWAKCPQGMEADLIQREITSFKQLDIFITDLINFLSDFIHSCPQARKQFIAMIKEMNAHKSVTV